MKRFGSNAFGLLIAAGLWAIPPMAHAQGCVPAHFMSATGLGARGIEYLGPGQWQANFSYRYLNSNEVFIGNEEQPQLHHVGTRNAINSFDLTAIYGLSSRFNFSLSLPFLHDNYSIREGDGERHSGSTGGVGDLRLVANGWVFDTEDHPEGNIILGLGVKFPTGDDHATFHWHSSDGDVSRQPVFISAQLGDGGYGIITQLQGFQKLWENLYGYIEGDYLINPRNENDTYGVPPNFPPNMRVKNTVPDSYFARAGFSYVIWPEHGLSLSLGGRIDGVPTHDLVGGSDGFRIAGYSVYVDPGLSWSYGRSSVSVNVPVAVERNIQDIHGSPNHAGALSGYLVVASYSIKF